MTRGQEIADNYDQVPETRSNERAGSMREL
jgi:hypothetical protein